MDGQLNAEEQQWVESALISNSQLAEKLRALTSLRDLVAGLSREAPVDVAPQVMARIKAVSRPRTVLPGFRSRRFRSRSILSPTGMLAAAAGLLAVASLVLVQGTFVHRRDPASAPRAAVGLADADSASTDRATVATLNVPDRTSSSHTEPFRSGAPGTVESVAGPHHAQIAELTESSAPRDVAGVGQYLDHPNLRRLFFVRNPRGEQTTMKVASIVERTTHHGFFKITISQGIVIDPRHPDQATVFALAVSAKDLNNLQVQLKAALPDLFEESPVEPNIVTQLADLGQVESFAAAPLAGVSISHDDLALRTKVASGAEVGESPNMLNPKTIVKRERPTVEQEQSAPIPDTLRPRGSGGRSAPERRSTPPPETRVAQTAGTDAQRESAIGNRESGTPIAHAGEAKTVQTKKSALDSPVPVDEIVVLVWVYESGPS
jgi:hypothetical protein